MISLSCSLLEIMIFTIEKDEKCHEVRLKAVRVIVMDYLITSKLLNGRDQSMPVDRRNSGNGRAN
jgi:hypothetical protein